MLFDEALYHELNTERYELTKTGRIQFNHPDGTPDNRFWVTALAVLASTLQFREKMLLLEDSDVKIFNRNYVLLYRRSIVRF
jgi:hypothetical protein